MLPSSVLEKAILDLPLTLEYLETHGVPVIGYGADEFPAFYSRKSGLGVDYRIDTPTEIAKAMQLKWAMGFKGGFVVANPIPANFEMEYSAINIAIDQAIKEAEQQKLSGKKITPFLLGRIKELTDGKSLDANIQLVLNNATLGAQIAIAYQKLKQV